jgi:hypothetical protein
MPATTQARRVRDGALTLVCLGVLIPVLVLGAAAVGLAPRHWSGIPLGGVKLPIVSLNPAGHGPRPSHMNEVTDAVRTDSAAVRVSGGSDGRSYVGVTRLNSTVFTVLGDRFSGDAVGVIYSPLEPVAYIDSPPSEGAAWWWQRTDPLGTWFTLVVGFPWAIAAGLVLASLTWALIVLRRRRKAASSATSMVSS